MMPIRALLKCFITLVTDSPARRQTQRPKTGPRNDSISMHTNGPIRSPKFQFDFPPVVLGLEAENSIFKLKFRACIATHTTPQLEPCPDYDKSGIIYIHTRLMHFRWNCFSLVCVCVAFPEKSFSPSSLAAVALPLCQDYELNFWGRLRTAQPQELGSSQCTFAPFCGRDTLRSRLTRGLPLLPTWVVHWGRVLFVVRLWSFGWG